MAQDENLAALVKLAEAVSSGNLAVLDEVFAPNVVDHDPAPDQGPGPDGYKFFFGIAGRFPRPNGDGRSPRANRERHCYGLTIHGTHRGEFAGIAPTGRPITARGMQIARFEDGKIVERWGSSDELGILLKLGAKVSPG